SRAALALSPPFTAFARRGHQLPTRARTGPWLVAQAQECPTVQRDHIKGRVLSTVPVSAAMAKRLSIAAGCCETPPVLWVVGTLAGIAPRLITGAVKGGDLAFVKNGLRLPVFGNRQLSRRPRRPGRALQCGKLRNDFGNHFA